MSSVTLSYRLARREDFDALRAFMNAAIGKLPKPFLNERQLASSRAIIRVDNQLLDDGTHFVVEADGELAGRGG